MELTKKYLKEAISGESSAVVKYTAFMETATQEGFTNIAYLFKALIAAEQIHIQNHRKALKDPDFQPKLENFQQKTTLLNIENAIEGELYEYKTMYPTFMKAIKKERKTMYGKVGYLSFEWARNVEITHANALKIALSALQSGKDLEQTEIWVCKVCGNLVLGDLPSEPCPICKHDPHFYKLIKNESIETGEK
ncbi:rubrerythrin family protein [Candidatus Lokiarchaeum ossiferum]|uniref:rubrerythrin family protein n=1 Tax=Candidatus Lokiarchaeum ossiferum TaxID=2951803 RepID=UPI00352C2004